MSARNPHHLADDHAIEIMFQNFKQGTTNLKRWIDFFPSVADGSWMRELLAWRIQSREFFADNVFTDGFTGRIVLYLNGNVNSVPRGEINRSFNFLERLGYEVDKTQIPRTLIKSPPSRIQYGDFDDSDDDSKEASNRTTLEHLKGGINEVKTQVNQIAKDVVQVDKNVRDGFTKTAGQLEEKNNP